MTFNKRILLLGLWALCAPCWLLAQGVNERANELYDRYQAMGWALSPGVVNMLSDGEHFSRQNGEYIERVRFSDGRVDTLFHAGEGLSSYVVGQEGTLLLTYGAHPIYRHSFSVDRIVCVRGGEVQEVAREVPHKRDATLSPDGEKVLFSSSNDLYLYDLNQGQTRRLTCNGAWNQIINGTTDWVYEEEFGFTKAYAFSPDSRRVAYLRFDESRVPLFEMMRFDGTLYNRAYTFKYPKAGDTNSTVTLHLIDLEQGTEQIIPTGENTDQYLPNLGWTPAGELYFYRVDRRQRLFEVVVDRTDEQQIIYAESSPRYVERPIGEMITFLDRDRFIVREETTAGWWHLYLHSVEKGRLRTLTSGSWEVTALVAADNRHVWYLSTESSPLRRDLYRIDLKGRNKCRLSRGEGWHSILAGAGMNYYIESFNSASEPGRVSVHRGDGTLVRTIAERPAPDFAWRKEFFTWRNERGDSLNAWVVRPRDFDSSRRYPIVLTQYSGPGSQEVSDRWRVDWTEALSEAGYIVACVDPRGTGFMGEAFKKQTYGDLGRREVEDQLSFARYWAQQPWVDASRMAVYGWSYGGFMALSCALKGQGLFKVAIAVAPVTSWRFYDSVYTETYNGLPEEFAQGYDENSPLNFPEKLSPDTRLLLIHGSGDDNVHLQNTMEMARRLNRDGAAYDMMIYPDQNHSMMPDDMRNVRVKMLGYLLEHL